MLNGQKFFIIIKRDRAKIDNDIQNQGLNQKIDSHIYFYYLFPNVATFRTILAYLDLVTTFEN